MNRWRVWMAAALLLVCSAAWAQQVQPAQPTQPVQGITLRHKFVPKQVTIYSMQGNGQGSISIAGLPGDQAQFSVPGQFAMKVTTRQRVLGVKPDGVATLRSVLDSMSLSMSATVQNQPFTMEMAANSKGMRMRVNGQEQPMSQNAKEMQKMNVFGKPFLSKMDSRGRLLGMTLPNMQVFKQASPGFNPSTLFQSGGSQVLLPEQPVNVGESWTNSINVPMPKGMPPFALQVVSQLVGTEQDAAGHTIARIQQSFNVSADNVSFDLGPMVKSKQPIAFRFDRLRVSSGGPIFWSVEEGKLVKADNATSVDVVVTVPMPTPQGGTPAGPLQITMNFQANVSMARQ